ncbi:anti-sigma factor family protein [Caenimonas terrae]|uniref:Anti-sigma factor family protein n=1 Tax=Caenimonas terrae TaxID=696074 RepID=A0ABW0ND90_9BURK
MNAAPPHSPVTESELHALVDGQLTAERRQEVESYLAGRPEEAARVQSYRRHKHELRALFDPVLGEALPARLQRAARPPRPWSLQRAAAGLAIALVGGAIGWGLRGSIGTRAAVALLPERAAMAHAVYSPEPRRAVEVSADQEDQLVTWLSKRMGAPMKPPHLQALGYTLEGGRLLPGGQGPVAQFMYHDPAGARLTLYVSRELPGAEAAGKGRQDVAFRFAREGQVNVFYWVDPPFGYAISAGAGQSELARVSAEVYRQLAAAR